MSKVQKLMDAKVVVQDPENEDKVIFQVPIHIPKIAIEMDGFEAFASSQGWTPTVDQNGEQVPNPKLAYVQCVEMIWDYVRGVFKAQLMLKTQEQARIQAQAVIAQILG